MPTNIIDPYVPILMARASMHLRGKLLGPALVNADYGSDAVKKGSYIPVTIARRRTAKAVTPGHLPTEASATEVDEVQVPVDQHWYEDFSLTDKDAERIYAERDFLPKAVETTMDALAEKINAVIYATYKEANRWVGVANALPFASNADYMADARAILNRNRAPGSDRRGILSASVDTSAIKLAQFSDADRAGTTRTQIEGELGKKAGIDWFWDNDIPSHTTAVAGTIRVDGASQTGSTLHIDGVTTVPVVGDLFTIAGSSTQYVVTSVGTLATADLDIGVYPAITTAHADDALLTFIGSHQANLVFHREAIAFAMRPMADSTRMAPKGADFMVFTDSQTGMSFRLERTRQHYQNKWAMDVLFGAKLVRRELILRLLAPAE